MGRTRPAAFYHAVGQGLPQLPIILKSDLGETIASIAGELGCGTDTVIRARRRYRQGGAKALHPEKPSGRKSRATPDFLAQMKEAVQTNPACLP